MPLTVAENLIVDVFATHLSMWGVDAIFTTSTPPGGSYPLRVWLERDIDYQISGYETETWEKRTKITYRPADLITIAPENPLDINDPPNPVPGDTFAIAGRGLFEIVSVEQADWLKIEVWVLPVVP